MPNTRLSLAAAALLLAVVASVSAAEEPMKPRKDAIPADTEVKSLPGGLKYCVLKEGGAGAKPKLGDKVRVHYSGWLTDGTPFDSSRERGVPAEFVLGQVIQGWNLALAEMTPGARWKITIPPDLGYGAAGAGGVIPPNATLVFDVELLSFKGAPAFRKPDPAAQKTTASGLKYEILAAGDGPACGPEDAVEIGYTLYDGKGAALESSDVTGRPILDKRERFGLAFMKEVASLVAVGGEVLIEVPPSLCWGDKAMASFPPNSTTVWRMKVQRAYKARPVPAFQMPPAEKLETTSSGLKIWIVKPGAGESPTPEDSVVVDYAGWLTDGTPFDDSFKAGAPATFPVGGLIPGWTEALQRLKPGAEAWLVIPGNLAYGPRPKGVIPANATLVFRMELHEVRK